MGTKKLEVKKPAVKPMSGRFKTMVKDDNLDKLMTLRGEKSRVIYDMYQDILKLPADQTLCLGTEEEFNSVWGAFKTSKNYIHTTLKGFGLKHPVIIRHKGNILVWGKDV